MSKFYEHNQRFELKKMIRWEVGILKVKTGILRSTLAQRCDKRPKPRKKG